MSSTHTHADMQPGTTSLLDPELFIERRDEVARRLYARVHSARAARMLNLVDPREFRRRAGAPRASCLGRRRSPETVTDRDAEPPWGAACEQLIVGRLAQFFPHLADEIEYYLDLEQLLGGEGELNLPSMNPLVYTNGNMVSEISVFEEPEAFLLVLGINEYGATPFAACAYLLAEEREAKLRISESAPDEPDENLRLNDELMNSPAVGGGKLREALASIPAPLPAECFSWSRFARRFRAQAPPAIRGFLTAYEICGYGTGNIFLDTVFGEAVTVEEVDRRLLANARRLHDRAHSLLRRAYEFSTRLAADPADTLRQIFSLYAEARATLAERNEYRRTRGGRSTTVSPERHSEELAALAA